MSERLKKITERYRAFNDEQEARLHEDEAPVSVRRGLSEAREILKRSKERLTRPPLRGDK